MLITILTNENIGIITGITGIIFLVYGGVKEYFKYKAEIVNKKVSAENISEIKSIVDGAITRLNSVENSISGIREKSISNGKEIDCAIQDIRDIRVEFRQEFNRVIDKIEEILKD